MPALRFCPNDDTKLQLVNLEEGKENVAEFVIKNPDEVVVQVFNAGLCGTDIHIVQGEFKTSLSSPITLGHEFSGKIVALGEEAKDHFKVGDKVAVDPNRGCLQCEVCHEGLYHYCKNLKCVGVKQDGGFSKFCVVPFSHVYRLPDNIAYPQGALCEPISCILHGWSRIENKVRMSKKVLIVGSGIIGNLWATLLHYKGVRNVVVSEASELRREITRKLGFGFRIISPNDLQEMEEESFDLVIDCTGVPAALEQAIGKTKFGATVLVFGCAPMGKSMKICPEEIFRKELTIMGTLINPNTFEEAVQTVSGMCGGEENGGGMKYLDIEGLGIRMFELQEYQLAMEALKKGEISKAMFQISQ